MALALADRASVAPHDPAVFCHAASGLGQRDAAVLGVWRNALAYFKVNE